MCMYKDCPLYDKCDKDIEQVFYCKQIELIKKLAKMRADMVRKKKIKRKDLPRPQIDLHRSVPERVGPEH